MGIGRAVHSYQACRTVGSQPIFSNTGSYMIFMGGILLGFPINHIAMPPVLNPNIIHIYVDFWLRCFFSAPQPEWVAGIEKFLPLFRNS